MSQFRIISMAVFVPAAFLSASSLAPFIFGAYARYIILAALAFSALFAWMLGNLFKVIHARQRFRYPLAGLVGVAITALTFIFTILAVVWLSANYPIGPVSPGSHPKSGDFHDMTVVAGILIGAGGMITGPILVPVGMVMGFLTLKLSDPRQEQVDKPDEPVA